MQFLLGVIYLYRKNLTQYIFIDSSDDVYYVLFHKKLPGTYFKIV